MSELRQTFNIIGGPWANTATVLDTTGTQNADGSNADDNGWNSSWTPSTGIGTYSWNVGVHGPHRIIYHTTLGWTGSEVLAGGWTVTTTSTLVTFTRNSDSWYFSFNPSHAWVSGSAPTGSTSGSGTSTEEVLVEDARIVDYGGITGFRFEQRGYAAASYELTGPGGPYQWTVSVGSNNLQYHISQLAPGTYYLRTGGNQIATLVASTRKKVFCNFW